ncbi:MAG TPA: hypothetical protein EYQ80_02750, partial [Candidatus Poseidoniales archaeon]|nr:hypothetical protein [Candidatus Poseidoniales archaeon]
MVLAPTRGLHLYLRTLETALDDQIVTDDEMSILGVISHAFALPDGVLGQCWAILRDQIDNPIDAVDTADHERRRIGDATTYQSAMITALEDEVITEDEWAMLDVMRRVMGIQPDENALIEESVRAMAAKVEAAKAGIEAAAKALPPPHEVVNDRAFVGDRMCMSCHSEQHAQWKSTPHAYAWSTLVKAQRSQDLDCYACHVTGAHHPEGPQTPRAATGLENVGCESCHGPGRDHIARPSANNITGAPEPSVCTQCHDGVKDEGRFELDAYL